MQKVLLLGASGSIGGQTIDVIKKNSDDFSLVAFSVGSRTRKITPLIKQFPFVKHICVKEKRKMKEYAKKYPHIAFYYGDSGLLQLIKNVDADLIVNALVGFVGLVPTIYALENDKTVCLANKEALVVGGEIVNALLDSGHGELYPIDSEHSALMKCLKVNSEHVNKMMLTASGGAFRKLSREQLKDVTASDALKHPTWKMGPKITIDCATMVNKAFEIIEAHYLYRYPSNKIGVTLHDESYVHSYITYEDGTMRLDISKPDMRNPIKLALYKFDIPFVTYNARSLNDFPTYHFHEFSQERYPMVNFASMVIDNKGTYGAIFNAANEVAVNAFLQNKISFLTIERIIEKLMSDHKNIKHPTLDQIIEADRLARNNANKLVEEWRK